MFVKKIITAFLFIFSCASVSAELIKNPTLIQKTIDEVVNTYHLPGASVSMIDTNTHQTWNFSSGLANKERRIRMRTSHLMQIGSTTKSFIAALILKLEEESEAGKLNIDFNIEQPLGLWLPEYQAWKGIKIKHLLNMTSGIYNYTDDAGLFREIALNPKYYWSPNVLVNLAYSHNPNTNFNAGENYEYSNTNYILAGMLLERLTNKTVEQLLSEKIFKKYPQRFQHIYYEPSSYPLGHFREMAHGYMMEKTQHAEFYQQDITALTLSWAGAAGAIISRSQDLANWADLLFSKQFLKGKQLRELQALVCVDNSECKSGEPLSAKSDAVGYGLGVGHITDERYGDIWTHNGGTLGYHTVFLYIPKLSLSMVVIVNQIGPEVEEMDDMIYLAMRVLASLPEIGSVKS
ncbi:D-alanyl-D-alanine carboxypeptidase precursor [Legionella massiliensis]|uniref:D-alanyl-D-alanine carboxypeptidase n=1 Tax=Legionella massiliensis TaxID=1034943 RepID=A0A078L207_9GAMM|nr:serine hydrolase [Legionella massiliensis]CDZ78058.1 D-alanyl-D-alanine carboxypeptidase precursor [Legionella massiliensis]CEE13796.1 D-alanyl-D-alanine carboxypeptidase precursor [Legionella massiliensis]